MVLGLLLAAKGFPIFLLKQRELHSRHKQTEELVSMLPDELKEKILLTTVTTTESPSEKSFLRGLSAENIHEFTSVSTFSLEKKSKLQIMSERSLPVLERSRRLREWAVDLLDIDAAERFERYVQFLEERGDRYKEKVGPQRSFFGEQSTFCTPWTLGSGYGK